MAKVRGRKHIEKAKKEEFVPLKNDDKEYPDEVDTSTSTGSSDPQMFFGILDRDELEYFKQTEATLAMDAFESPEEKSHFVTRVFEEFQGKELKLVTSQITSKLVERVILHCTDDQLKTIFEAFNGFFFNISCHKYASHVLETLLVRSAALVEKELLTPSFEQTETADGRVHASMENMFLFMLNELKSHLKLMIKQQYASHVLRLLILILSSKTLPKTTMNNSALRSKRSKIARKMIDIKDNEDYDKLYQTPESFKKELREMVGALYREFAGDTSTKSEISTTKVTQFREYCVDKVASPVIQLIIQVEGIFDRDRSFWRLAFSTSEEKNAKEESFVEYLLSDPVGSHFLENVIAHARVKYVQRLYHLYMKDRIIKLAKRDSTAAFVIRALLQTLKGREVKEILDEIIPELSMLINSNMDFGTAIIDSSIKQDNYLREKVIDQLLEKYYPRESSTKNILESCLQLSSSTLGNTRDDWPTADERRRSLFLEKLIDYDDKFLDATIESMLSLPEQRLTQMCFHGVFSHVVEHVLQPTRVDAIKRKLLLNRLSKDVVNMACNAYGSHIMDHLWAFTAKLMLYKERIGAALAEEAEKVKNSVYGRQVWKNWKMELYVRKRWDWKKAIKDQELEMFPDSKPLQPKGQNDGADRKRHGDHLQRKPAHKRLH